MAILLKITIVEVAQVEFYVIVDQVVDAKDGSRHVADFEENIDVDVADEAVHVFIPMHLDVVALGS